MRTTVSIILKLVVIASVCLGVVLNALAGGGRMFLYFTIQSNIWIALVCLLELALKLCGVKSPRVMSVVKLVFTVSITLTGMVYCFMLAPFIGEGAFALSSSLVHVVSPVAAVADYFVCRKDLRLKMKDAWWALLPPLYYLGFAALGFVLAWDFGGGAHFPYYFLDWGSPAGTFGFVSDPLSIGVMYYVAFLLLFLLGMSRLYIRLTPRS